MNRHQDRMDHHSAHGAGQWARWGVVLLAGLSALASGCVHKPQTGNHAVTNQNTATAAGRTASVAPPTKAPDCKVACRYFVYCQSARWSTDDEQKELRDRCVQDCGKAKGAAPKSQEDIFFGGLRKCAVGRACVPFGKCMRAVVAELQKAAGAGQPQEDPNAVYKVPVAGSPTQGPADAPVTVVMFADYQCPFCHRGWATLGQLVKAYPGKIRVVYKQYPLPMHPQGKTSAQAANCVRKQKGDAAFWKYHDRLYGADDLSEASLLKHAQAVGADPGVVKKCMAAGTHAALLKADLALGTQLGVDGTPAFFFNGKKVSGAQPIEALKKAYTDALGRAEQAIKGGVAPAKVYEHLIQNGASRPVMLKGPTSNGPPAGPPELDPEVTFRIPVSRHDAQKGPANALVTIVEFADFQCPACALASTRLAQVVKEFPKDVRMIYRHMPLAMHQDAQLAAEAALAVRAQKGDAGFWAYHDKLYANQRDLSQPVLEKLATQLGVDLARFRKALADHTFRAQTERDKKFGERMGIAGTPAIYFNGRVMMGVPRTYEALKARVEKEIAAARKRLGGGVTRATLYDTLQKDAKTEPVFRK